MNLAAQIAEEAARVHRTPSDRQKEAGNYRKGHVRVHGLDISIENPRGSLRRGVGSDGVPWKSRLPAHYGYIRRTQGADGDHVDVYLGPHHKSPLVYVVDQENPDTGDFDEHKAFIGFASPKQVRNTYMAAFSDGRGRDRLGHLSEMTVAQFCDWLRNGDTKQPLHRASGGRIPTMADGGDVPDFDPDVPAIPIGSEDAPQFDAAMPAVPLGGHGALSNRPGDGWISAAAKGAGTGIIRGLANSIGTVGNLGQFADYLLARGHSALTGRPVEEVLADYAKRRAASPASAIDPSQVLPTGEQVAAPILRRTGEYRPETALGRAAQAGVEAAASMVGPGGGAAVRGAPASEALATAGRLAPINLGVGAAAQGVSEATGDPLAGMAAGVALPAAAGKAVAQANRIVRNIAEPFAEDLPIVGNRFAGQREQMVRDRLLQSAENPESFENALFPGPRRPGGDELVPGSEPTTGQLTGDMGILQAERRAQTEDNTPFNMRATDQDVARRGALEDLSPADADVMRPSQFFQDQLNLVERGANQAVDRIRSGAQELAERVGQGSGPEAQGASIRNPIRAIYEEAKQARRRLYDAVDPDGSINLVAAPVRERADELAKSLDPLGAPMSGEESRIFAKVRALPDVIPFKSLIALDSDIYAVMSAERRAAGETPVWGRLSQLKKSVSNAINGAVDNQAAYEQAAVAAGAMRQADTIEARLDQLHRDYHGQLGAGADEAQGAARANAGSPEAGLFDLPPGAGDEAGRSRVAAGAESVPAGVPRVVPQNLNDVPIYYPGGNLRARYEVVDLGDLRTSHDANFSPRADYPAELQPRERGSAPARDQVNTMAARLQPERLGPSPEANSGAPIVGPDNVVESGNGRTLALAKAYERGNTAYRDWLQSQGFDTAGMERPVLIARRTSAMTPAQREFFANSANNASALRMSAAEQAGSDAKLLSPSILDRVADGPIQSAENRDFVRAFADKLPAAERGGFLDRDGNLSQSGVKRLEAALAARAYDDPAFVGRAFDSADSNIRNLAGALVDAAGPWARMREAAQRGDIAAAHDVTPELMDVVRKVMRARDENVNIADVLRQSDMFGSDVAPLIENLMFRDADRGILASRRRIAEGLRAYADEAQKNSAGPRLFADDVSPRDVLETAVKRVSRETDEPPPSTVEADADIAPTFESGAGERVRGLEPNFDDAAAQRLRSAKESHQRLAETYRNKTVGPVLKTQGGADNYAVAQSAVPGRAVVKGDRGYDTAKSFLDAGRNSPEVVTAMQDRVLDPVRRSLNADGTVNPTKFANWKRDYAGALRALDEVDPGFSGRFDNAAKATDVLMRAGAKAEEQIAAAQKSEAAKFIKASTPSEVENMLGQILQSKRGPSQMRDLLRSAADRPEVIEGLRKAGIDWIARKMSTTSESGTTGDKKLAVAAFDRLMRDNSATLSQLFTPEQMNVLRAIAQDMQRSARRLATNVAGSPGSAKDVAPQIERAMQAAKRHTSLIGAGVAGLYAGLHVGGIKGALTMAGLEAGGYLLGTLRAAGIRKVDDMFRDALLHPERARFYLAKIPPDTLRPAPFMALSNAIRRTLITQPQLIRERKKQ